MTYVVVIRKEGAKHNLGEVYHTNDLPGLLYRLRHRILKHSTGAPRTSPCSTPEAENYIRQNYGRRVNGKRISATQIASDLSASTGQRITKNMVISRAHRIGVAGEQ